MEVTNLTPAKLGVVLAGGLGRRLGGGTKALVELAGRPLAAHVAGRLAPQLAPGRLLLNANGPAERFASVGLPVIADGVPGRPGPLAGILAAMRVPASIAAGAEWVVSAPTDTPFLPRDLLARLAGSCEGAEVVLAASPGGLCQVCGLWSVRLAPALANALDQGENKVLAFVERLSWRQVNFPSERIGVATVDPFYNINTPQDLAFAEERLSEGLS